MRFLPEHELLSPGEIVRICGGLVDCGIRQLRITGGEPTLRSDFRSIISGLAGLPAEKIALTTNGRMLNQHLEFLRGTSLRHLNYSLDSLDADNFRRLTGSDSFADVYATILRSIELGFQVKVNTVVFRGVNDREVKDFLRFSAKHGVEVRFLELMRIGPAHERNRQLFIAAEEILERLRAEVELEPLSSPADSTSTRYITRDGARLGFIASETQPFCENCSRLRLSATGRLRPCLMSEQSVDLRGKDIAEFPALVEQILRCKPLQRPHHVDEPMVQIGG